MNEYLKLLASILLIVLPLGVIVGVIAFVAIKSKRNTSLLISISTSSAIILIAVLIGVLVKDLLIVVSGLLLGVFQGIVLYKWLKSNNLFQSK
jgi:hypothetical protein